MTKDYYSQEQMKRVVRYALAAARASQDGLRTLTLGEGDTAQKFDLCEGGMCARFVRQIYETACGLDDHSWRYAAASALEMCENLRTAGYQIQVKNVDAMLPGDIIGINRNSGKYGHIGIFVGVVDGVASIAENTSSASRGRPLRAGTKLTSYSAIASRVTGVYRLASATRQTWPDYRAFVLLNGKYVEIELATNGDHRRDQGKTYWRIIS